MDLSRCYSALEAPGAGPLSRGFGRDSRAGAMTKGSNVSNLPDQLEAAKLGAGYPPEAIKQLETLIEAARELAAARAQVTTLQKRREVEVVRAVDVFGLDYHTIATAAGLTDSRIGQILVEAG